MALTDDIRVLADAYGVTLEHVASTAAALADDDGDGDGTAFRDQTLTVTRGGLYDLLTTIHHAQHELTEKRYRAGELYVADAYREAQRLTYEGMGTA